ncbi:hypothetical protein DES53_1099 [Roseimicrobium gellanilyticum]|uniref:Uncharacterized protein n=1 Tax=Roseimicrobium gellanilyticum TaxID=748857 RepID=A0A366HB47_9BACT|nr:hypothetical protein [Roseimicrobium gellanilyticum]RBP39582.1 hypothetical protein DES53_1099 [Roseimicrobium gellanilyticum]
MGGSAMVKKKGFPFPATSAVATLFLLLAWAVFLPLPEDRVFDELLRVEIKSIRWNGVTPREAVAELNAEIQKVSDTRFRFFVAEDARSDIPVHLELNRVLAVECAEYLGQESGNRHYLTSRGYVIDNFGKERTYDQSSWRRFLHGWIRHSIPQYWRKLCGQPEPDPIWGPR